MIDQQSVRDDASLWKVAEFQAKRFAAPVTANGDPIHERFNDDELRMLGPVLRREYEQSEPPIEILDDLPVKRFDRVRILQTVVEYCMYKGWLTLGAEASRRAQFPNTLELWAGKLDEEQRSGEAEQVRAHIQTILNGS